MLAWRVRLAVHRGSFAEAVTVKPPSLIQAAEGQLGIVLIVDACCGRARPLVETRRSDGQVYS